MELANALVSLGGDNGNTVGKYNITPSEVAVLRAIHGDDAVQDIKIVATVNRSNRVELERLQAEYGAARDNDNRSVLGQLFPGIAARVFEKFKELELDEALYAPPERPKRKPKVEAAPVEEVITPINIPASVSDPLDDLDDGIGDLGEVDDADPDVLS